MVEARKLYSTTTRSVGPGRRRLIRSRLGMFYYQKEEAAARPRGHVRHQQRDSCSQASVVIVPLLDGTRPDRARALGLAGTSATSNAILVQASVAARRHAPDRAVAPWVPTRRGRTPRHRSVIERRRPRPAADGGLGIALSLCSAAFYALHTLRLSEYGDVHATVQAAGQVVSNAVLDILALPLAGRFAGGNAAAWLSGAHHGALRRLALASAWNGVMIVGVTTWAMSFAQQAFPATTAALAYATVWGHIHSIKRQLRTSHPTHPSPCAAAAAGAAIRRPHRRAPHARAALGGAASRRGTRDFGEPRRCETTITSG